MNKTEQPETQRLPRVVRVLNLYEFEDGHWDAIDDRLGQSVRVADHTLSADPVRVVNTDKKGICHFVNVQLDLQEEKGD